MFNFFNNLKKELLEEDIKETIQRVDATQELELFIDCLHYGGFDIEDRYQVNSLLRVLNKTLDNSAEPYTHFNGLTYSVSNGSIDISH